jgi:hypothetical protein
MFQVRILHIYKLIINISPCHLDLEECITFLVLYILQN